jgi:hypothetical protein
MTRYWLAISINLFFNLCGKAQIGVGTEMRDMNMSFSYNKSLVSPAPSGSYSTSLQNNYGRFLTDNLYLGGSLNLTTSRLNISTPQSVNTFLIYGGYLVGRYYVNPSADWKFFAETSMAYRRGKSQNTIPNIYNTYTLSQINASITAGLDYFLTETFALEGRLTFIFTKYYSDNNFVKEGGEDRTLNIRPINFIQPKSKEKLKNLVSKGRMLVDGGIRLVSSSKDLFTNKRSYTSGMSVDVGYFITKGLVVGGYAGFDLLNNYSAATYNFAPNIGYFYPIYDKLFAQAKIEYGFYGDNFTTSKRVGTRFSSEVGLSYFVFKNAALQVNFLDINKLVGKENRTVIADISLLYFMK